MAFCKVFRFTYIWLPIFARLVVSESSVPWYHYGFCKGKNVGAGHKM